MTPEPGERESRNHPQDSFCSAINAVTCEETVLNNSIKDLIVPGVYAEIPSGRFRKGIKHYVKL